MIKDERSRTRTKGANDRVEDCPLPCYG
jgi:hypothetical protein